MADPVESAGGTLLALLDPEGLFLPRLAADRKALRALAGQLWTIPIEERHQRLDAMERLAHRLAGAAGTFGLSAISDVALELEDRLAEIRGRAVIPRQRAGLEATLQHLDTALAACALGR